MRLSSGIAAGVALLLAAGSAAAQSCLELPVPRAGWGVQVEGTRSGALTDEFTGAAVPAASAFGIRGGRDFPGSISASAGWTATGYEIPWFSSGMNNSGNADVRQHHLNARFAYLTGGGPLNSCPVLELGWFTAEAGAPADFTTGGVSVGAGWTLERVWYAGAGLNIVPFVTPQLLVVLTRGTGDLDHHPYEGSEVLPKLDVSAGASVVGRSLFMGLDGGLIFPGGDPRFWLRHSTADDRPALRLAVRAGMTF